jgi:hypothetical protein
LRYELYHPVGRLSDDGRRSDRANQSAAGDLAQRDVRWTDYGADQRVLDADDSRRSGGRHGKRNRGEPEDRAGLCDPDADGDCDSDSDNSSANPDGYGDSDNSSADTDRYLDDCPAYPHPDGYATARYGNSYSNRCAHGDSDAKSGFAGDQYLNPNAGPNG